MSRDPENQDDYPFDRPHWSVSVSLPIEHLARKDEALKVIGDYAESRGGRLEMSSEPSPEFLGKPGYTTFGAAVAFEAGDANARGFMNLVKTRLNEAGLTGATTEMDEADIIYPASYSA